MAKRQKTDTSVYVIRKNIRGLIQAIYILPVCMGRTEFWIKKKRLLVEVEKPQAQQKMSHGAYR